MKQKVAELVDDLVIRRKKERDPDKRWKMQIKLSELRQLRDQL